MSRSFELPDVEWATVGTVGPPGQRTFYLQARQDDQQVTLKLEKQQVAAIAQFLGEILSDLPVADPCPTTRPWRWPSRCWRSGPSAACSWPTTARPIAS